MLRYWEMLYDCVRILWTMTLTASVIIVPVLAVRLLLKRAPKFFSYALWAAILFRLLCPVSIPASFSALGLTGFPVYEAAPSSALTCIASGPASWPTLSEQAPAPRAIYPMDMIIAVWLAGIVAMALYSAVSLLRLRRRLIGAVHLDKNIWLADHIQSPFVIGILRPKIYLPSNLPEQERAYILLHEEYHIRRLDHIVKLLFFCALCIHWFNPLVWLAFILAGKDMEMSCDEAVIRELDPDVRADYSASLLRITTGRGHISAAPLAFGEGSAKGRIRNLLRWKRPQRWAMACAGALCVCMIASAAVNPQMGNSVSRSVRNVLRKDVPLALSCHTIGGKQARYENCWDVGSAVYVSRQLNNSVWRPVSQPKDLCLDDFLWLAMTERCWSMVVYRDRDLVRVDNGAVPHWFQVDSAYENLRSWYDELEALAETAASNRR